MAVVFDIGNVLLRWDPRNLFRKLFADDAAGMEWFLAHVCDSAWNLEQDRGRSFAAAVTERVAEFPEWEAQIRAYDERWPETLDGVIEPNLALLRRLRAAQVPCYAITNYSREKFALTRTLHPFLDEFDGIVVSGEVGLVKPDPRIFHLLLERHGLAAEACVFIDDSAINVAGAEAIGMRAIHFTEGDDLAAALRGLGLPA
jgi:2-haloacid dehalogenase